MQKITTILILLFLFNITFNQANAKPFELDTFDQNYKPEEIGLTYSKLNQLTSKCIYDVRWLDMDVDLKSGVSSRQRGFTEAQDTFVGLVATVPLFSGKEMDRERDRALGRKRQAADDIATMIENVEKVLHNRRMMAIYKVMEGRSKKRVMAGVVPLSEQVDIMEKLSNLRKETITFLAQIGGKHTALLNSCKDGKDKNELRNYMDEELDKLKIKF
jgi:hypothetical protein